MASKTDLKVGLRPVADSDREFLLAVYASTRKEELDQVSWVPGEREKFIRMQFDAQDFWYRAQNPDASFDVVEVDGKPAGRLYVDRRTGEIRIVDVALLPKFRGDGIGAHLIGQVLDEATETDCAVTIHVEIHNRAAELCSRLGFVVAEEIGRYRRMEWTP